MESAAEPGTILVTEEELKEGMAIIDDALKITDEAVK